MCFDLENICEKEYGDFLNDSLIVDSLIVDKIEQFVQACLTMW